ncbi:2OG-Fe(II) oxygenase family protein [Gluconobacter wancherniae]|uniref:2OG-Fe(II) oxygenase family protein n=1 Tax=Gluconobacter wancherniae TaxID=1307955 RepID=UPI001B8B3D07|nr:2OG-Fe(II) oxygenase [Gluconobacter wancherniae]MBS1088558.1 2OG-Fe(II) oxygenase [Gluconobacter wancherniae]
MSMISLAYDALKRTSVAEDPFPHVVVPHFIGNDDLQTVVSELPEMASGGSFPPESLKLTPNVAAMINELQGPKLKALIAEKFGLDLLDAPTMLTVRGRTREKDGRIHRDSEAKLVTVLLYLNPRGEDWTSRDGCLRLLRGPDDVEDYAVEVVPAEGTLLVFPNGPKTWHGHRQFVGTRYAIQLNYMATGRKAQYELGRHRLSALVKRLPFSG